MKTGEFNLINVEEKIHPERNISADLLLKRKSDSIEILIEVLNLHFEIQSFNNFEELECLLKSKLNEKVKNKLINDERHIFIQPVIWIKDLEQLKFICDFYKSTKFKIENVFVPMSHLSFKHQNGDFEHRFESINTILIE